MQGNSQSSWIPLLISSGPTFVVCVLGMLFSLLLWGKSPKAAILVIISLIVLLILAIVRPMGYMAMSHMNRETHFVAIQVWNLFCNLVGMACVAGLLFAAFCDRAPRIATLNPYAQAAYPNAPPQFGGPPPMGNPYAAPAPQPPLGSSMPPPQ